MLFLASKGYRCIAHDRRGHGRSSQPWDGNDTNTYADDLSELIERLDLEDAVPGVTASQGMIDSSWRQGMQAGHKTRASPRPPGRGCWWEGHERGD